MALWQPSRIVASGRQLTDKETKQGDLVNIAVSTTN